MSQPAESGSVGSASISGNTIVVHLREEVPGQIGHWFLFDIHSPSRDISINISNAGKALYPRGWVDYHPFYSLGGSPWQRVPASTYRDGCLRFDLSCSRNTSKISVAWYEPYPLSRLETLISEASRHAHVAELQGDLSAVSFGAGDRSVLVIARQHPGEVMSSFVVEGLIRALLSEDDEVTKLLKSTRVIVVPMANPMGVQAGNHRFGIDGSDYNRTWGRGRAPKEVEFVKTLASNLPNLALFFDVHGDEVSTGSDYVWAYPSGRDPSTRLEGLLMSQLNLNILRPRSGGVRLVRALLRGEPLRGINIGCTAARYFARTYGVPSFTYETLAHSNTPHDCIRTGKELAKVLARFIA